MNFCKMQNEMQDESCQKQRAGCPMSLQKLGEEAGQLFVLHLCTVVLCVLIDAGQCALVLPAAVLHNVLVGDTEGVRHAGVVVPQIVKAALLHAALISQCSVAFVNRLR